MEPSRGFIGRYISPPEEELRAKGVPQAACALESHTGSELGVRWPVRQRPDKEADVSVFYRRVGDKSYITSNALASTPKCS